MYFTYYLESKASGPGPVDVDKFMTYLLALVLVTHMWAFNFLDSFSTI